MLELIKNPIVLGIITATIVYIYLDWKRNEKSKKKLKDVNILIPLSVGCISGLIFYFIFNNTGMEISAPIIQEVNPIINPINPVNPIKLNPEDMNTSFHLVGRNITIPHNIPDLMNM